MRVRPSRVEKYTDDPIAPSDSPRVSTINKIGRKNGMPMMSTPPRIGRAATATVASGTVGTSNNFTAGTFFGISETNPTVLSEMISTALMG
mmetsp:Transcript_23410/g.38123  ORF Transcript_23410/g.38123 Transcript_23410/m.38123 type:complete len:91 (-) Transcript_23410:33-305(-)